MYGFWDIECDRHCGPFFARLPSYGPRKSKFWKNEKHARRYYHFTNMCYEWQSYDVWFLRHRARRAEFFVILDDFLLFYPTNKPRKSRFWRTEKKMPGDIAILYKCTKISDGCNFYFSFWAIFCLFTSPPNNSNNQNFKNMKKVPRDIIILHMCTKYNDHTMQGSWDMVREERTDEKRWDIEVGAPPKNFLFKDLTSFHYPSLKWSFLLL